MAREDNRFRRVNGFISIILFGLLVLGFLVSWFYVGFISIFWLESMIISIDIFVFFVLRLHISIFLYIF